MVQIIDAGKAVAFAAKGGQRFEDGDGARIGFVVRRLGIGFHSATRRCGRRYNLCHDYGTQTWPLNKLRLLREVGSLVGNLARKDAKIGLNPHFRENLPSRLPSLQLALYREGSH